MYLTSNGQLIQYDLTLDIFFSECTRFCMVSCVKIYNRPFFSFFLRVIGFPVMQPSQFTSKDRMKEKKEDITENILTLNTSISLIYENSLFPREKKMYA